MQSMFSAQRSATASGRKVGAPQSSTSKGRPILIADLATASASARCELKNFPQKPMPTRLIPIQAMKRSKGE